MDTKMEKKNVLAYCGKTLAQMDKTNVNVPVGEHPCLPLQCQRLIQKRFILKLKFECP